MVVKRKAMKSVRYLVSLPERGVRSTSALAGGLVKELTDVVLPASLRRTRLYRSLVELALRFLLEEVGQVKYAPGSGGRIPDDFLLRKTAGNGIELMGILLFRLSPVWVLAVLADLSHTGRRLLAEIVEDLKKEGLLEKETDFETVDQLLDGLEKTSSRMTENVVCPPLDIRSLRRELETLRQEAQLIPVGKVPSLEKLTAAWRNLKREAEAQKCSLFGLSSLLALSALAHLPRHALWLSQCAGMAARTTGTLLAGSLLEHYSQTLQKIHRTGYLSYWVMEFAPYVSAAASNFSPRQLSWTEKFLDWCLRKGSVSAREAEGNNQPRK
jgi:hypothetical protein